MTTKTDFFNRIIELYKESDSKERRLNSCSAYYKDITTDNNKRFRVLKSYSTIVAAYSCDTGNLYVRDYYSSTTTQHIYKFKRLVSAYRMVFLYRRSDNIMERAIDYEIKGKKWQWESAISRDWIGHIESI